MRIFAERKKPEERGRPSDDNDFWFQPGGVFSLMRGGPVRAKDALGISAVWAAVNHISRSIATLPLHVYESQSDGSRRRVLDHPISRLLRLQPNRWQTHSDFIRLVVVNLLLRGNFYAQILRTKGGVKELIPLDSDKIAVTQTSGGDLQYTISLSSKQVTLSQSEILHIKGLSLDGIEGVSVLECAARTLRISTEIDEHSEKFFRNRGVPGLVLEHPGRLGEGAAKRLAESFTRSISRENAYATAVIEEGMKLSQVQLSAADAQFVEQKRLQLEDIARLFSIPPHLIGDLSRSTYSNIESQGIDYVVFCLLPWLRCIEEVINIKLLHPKEQDVVFVEFLVDGLLRGDQKSRYEAYVAGRNAGFLSVNDIRRMENMPPLTDGQGDIYLLPVNMVDAKTGGIKPTPVPTEVKA